MKVTIQTNHASSESPGLFVVVQDCHQVIINQVVINVPKRKEKDMMVTQKEKLLNKVLALLLLIILSGTCASSHGQTYDLHTGFSGTANSDGSHTLSWRMQGYLDRDRNGRQTSSDWSYSSWANWWTAISGTSSVQGSWNLETSTDGGVTWSTLYTHTSRSSSPSLSYRVPSPPLGQNRYRVRVRFSYRKPTPPNNRENEERTTNPNQNQNERQSGSGWHDIPFFYYGSVTVRTGVTSSVTLTGSPPVPTMPLRLTVPSNSDTGSATINWPQATETITRYRLQRRKGSGSWGSDLTLTSPTTTSYEESGLAYGSYTYRVSACNFYGCGSWRSGSNSLVVGEIPQTPSRLTVPTASDNGSTIIQWASVAEVADYELQRRLGSGSWSSDLTSTNFMLTRFNNSSLPNGTYSYRIRACNATGCSGWRSGSNNLVVNRARPLPAPPSMETPPAPEVAASLDKVTNRQIAASDRVGTTAGSFRVNESGGATYSVPIMSAPGTAGVQPQLSLSYSSQGGNGLLGMNWSLGGLSQISRCRQTLQQDKNPKPITWGREDRFCLDGQRLLVTSGEYGDHDSTYRTEIDSFAEVTLKTVNGRKGASAVPDYFVVTRKDGSTSRYGWPGISGAEFKAANTDGSASNDVLTWSIRRMLDNVGNQIHFRYEGDASTGQRLERVRYAYNSRLSNGEASSANGQSGYGAETILHYEDRSDPATQYLAGRKMTQSKRLSRIEVKNGSATLRNYNLNYTASKGTTSPDQRTRLWGIKECDASNNCLPPTRFTWQLPARASTSTEFGQQQSATIDISAHSQQHYAWTLGDFNGDGHQDVAWLQFSTSDVRLYYRLYQPNASPPSFGPSRSLASGWQDNLNQHDITLHVADYNADGRMDLFVWRQSEGKIRIYLATPKVGSGTEPRWDLVASSHSVTGVNKKPHFLDLNSDGLVDLTWGDNVRLLTRQSSVASTSSTAYSFVTGPSFVHGIRKGISVQSKGNFRTADTGFGTPLQQVGDINGDGRVDYYGEFSTGGRTCHAVYEEEDEEDAEGYGYGYRYLDSYNCSDITAYAFGITTEKAGSNPAFQLERFDHNNSLTTLPYNRVSSANTKNWLSQTLLPVDANGDGLSDVLILQYKNGDASPYQWKLYLSTGTSHVPYKDDPVLIKHRTYDDAINAAPGFADINGDGYLDFYYSERIGVVNSISVWWTSYSYDSYARVRYWQPESQSYAAVQTLFTTSSGGSSAKRVISFASLDTDQSPDRIVVHHYNGNDVLSTYRASDDASVNLITGITNGLGAVTEISYESLSATDHYRRVQGVRLDEELRPKTVVCGGGSSSGGYGKILGIPGNFPSFPICTTVTSNLANTEEFYQHLNEPFAGGMTSHLLDPQKNSPVLELFGPMPVVTSVSSSSPTASDTNAKASVKYHYEQAKIQAGGRGMLGFKSLSTTDMQTGVVTTTTYRQDWPFIGHPSITEVKDKRGVLLSLANNEWKLANISEPSGGAGGASGSSGAPVMTLQSAKSMIVTSGSAAIDPMQPYIAKSIERAYDLAAEQKDPATAIPLTTSVTESTYDRHGNPTRITLTQYAGNNSASNWLLQTTTENRYADTGYGTEKSKRYGRLTRTDVTTSKKNASGTMVNEQKRRSTFDYNNVNGLLREEKVIYLTTSGSTVSENAKFSLTTNYEHDSFGNVTRTIVKGWDGSASWTGSNTTTRTSRTLYESNRGRYIDKQQNHYGQTLSDVVTRNAHGAPTRATDINGISLKTAYTPMGRQYWQHSEAGSSSVSLMTRDAGQCSPALTAYRSYTLAGDGAESHECFDILGRKIRGYTRAFDGDWIFQDTEYDTLGRVSRKSEPWEAASGSGTGSHWTSFEYDILGRVTRTTLPDGSTGSASYTGLTITTTNDHGHTRTETRNALNRLVEVRDNQGVTGASATEKARVTYAYDALGNLTSLTSHHQSGDTVSSNVTTTITYDALGRKVSMNDPDKGAWSYAYNAFGEIISQTSANQSTGATTRMRYDRMGRMTSRTDYTPRGVTEATTTWQRDNSTSIRVGIGQLTSVTHTNWNYRGTNALSNQVAVNYTQRYAYDRFGRRIKTTATIGDNGNLGTYHQKATFDQYGRPFQVLDIASGSHRTGSNSHGVQYSYNDYGYQTETTDVNLTNGVRESYHQVQAMNERGQVTKERRGSTVTHYRYDAATGRLCHKHTGTLLASVPTYNCTGTSDPSTALASNRGDIQDLAYRWDTLGNLTRRWEYSGSKSLQESFSYDRQNRLTQAAVTGGATTNVTYDSRGNIKSKTGVGTYRYGAGTAGPHAVTSITGGSSYTYDRNGNNLTGDGRTLHYTSFDKVYRITKGTHTTRFTYGPDRARFLREDWQGASLTTRTLYVGASEYHTNNSTGATEIKRMVAGALITLRYTSGLDTTADISKALVFTDHLGSTDVITDFAGAIIQEQSFNPWGERRNASNWRAMTGIFSTGFTLAGRTHTGIKQGFTGHEMLDEVGIIHMNGRIYDARLARFLQADPNIQSPGNSQSLNRYSYVLNNPLNATDPSGFFFKKLFRGVKKALNNVFRAANKLLGDFAPLASIAISIWLPGAGFWGDLVNGFTSVVVSGFLAGGVGSGTLDGAIHGGISAAAFYGVGGVFKKCGDACAGSFAGTELSGLAYSGKVALHGLAGGVMSTLQGGKFGHGFASAGFAQANSGWIGKLSDARFSAKRIITAAAVGGTASRLSGGKFANGAVTAAFSRAFNDEKHAQTVVKRKNPEMLDIDGVTATREGKGVLYQKGKASVLVKNNDTSEGAIIPDVNARQVSDALAVSANVGNKRVWIISGYRGEGLRPHAEWGGMDVSIDGFNSIETATALYNSDLFNRATYYDVHKYSAHADYRPEPARQGLFRAVGSEKEWTHISE